MANHFGLDGYCILCSCESIVVDEAQSQVHP